MEALGNTPPCLMMDDDDIFNFSLDDGDDAIKTIDPLYPSSNLNSSHPPDDHSRSFPDFPEEELEWLLNKDAFPAVETGLDIFMPNQNHLQSPISVLENSTSSSNSNGSATMNYCGALPIPVSFPVRARSKRRRRRRRGFPELPVQQVQQQSSWWNQVNIKNVKQEFPKPLPVVAVGSAIGRRCQHCLAEKTPQWRAGPLGPKTLCNACGVRYKSGRLVPEYRPASSPTFSSQLHSNSHRKIMEMRKHTQVGDMMVK